MLHHILVVIILYSVFSFNTGIFHVPQAHQRTSVMLWKSSAIMVQFLWLVKWSISLLLSCPEENFVTLPWDPEHSCCLLIPVWSVRSKETNPALSKSALKGKKLYLSSAEDIILSKVRNDRSPQNNALRKAPPLQKLPAVLFPSLGFDLDSEVFWIWILDFSAYYPI